MLFRSSLENELFQVTGESNAKEYREQLRKLVELIKKKGKQYFEDINAQNIEPELKAIIELGTKQNSSIKNPFGGPRVVKQPPAMAPFIKPHIKIPEHNNPKAIADEKEEEIKEYPKKNDKEVSGLQVEHKEISKITKNDSSKIIEDEQSKVLKNEPQKEIKSEAGEMMKNKPPKTIENEPPKIIQNETQKRIENELSKTIENEVPKTIENKPPTIIENEPPEIIENELSKISNPKEVPHKNKVIRGYQIEKKFSEPLKIEKNFPKPKLITPKAKGNNNDDIEESISKLLKEEQELISQSIINNPSDSEPESESQSNFPSIIAEGTPELHEKSSISQRMKSFIDEGNNLPSRSATTIMTQYNDIDSLQIAYKLKQEELIDYEQKIKVSEGELEYCKFTRKFDR